MRWLAIDLGILIGALFTYAVMIRKNCKHEEIEIVHRCVKCLKMVT